MKIKKQLKREKSRRTNLIIFSLIVMALMPYLVISLNRNGLFKGWEIYFAFSYAAIVDILLLANIFRTASEGVFEMSVLNGKLKIKDSFLKPPFILHPNRIAYVDIIEKPREDFEILLVIEKGRRLTRFLKFDIDFIKQNIQYSGVFNQLLNLRPEGEFFYYLIKRGGAKKYYYLYLIYKNAYESQFSQKAVDYVKRFMEEYKAS